MKRITSDIDKQSRLILIYYLIKAIIKIKKIRRIEVERSHHNNWHITIWTNYPYRKYQVFKLRKIIGDDEHRLYMDKVRRFGRDTLFYKKEKFIE